MRVEVARAPLVKLILIEVPLTEEDIPVGTPGRSGSAESVLTVVDKLVLVHPDVPEIDPVRDSVRVFAPVPSTVNVWVTKVTPELAGTDLETEVLLTVPSFSVPENVPYVTPETGVVLMVMVILVALLVCVADQVPLSLWPAVIPGEDPTVPVKLPDIAMVFTPS